MKTNLYSSNQIERVKRMIDEIPNMSEKEKTYRKKRVDGEIEKLKELREQVHEINSYYFLQQVGKVSLSEDHRHIEGADIVLETNMGNYYIECTRTSFGSKAFEEQLEINKITETKFEEEQILSGEVDAFIDMLGLRLTNSISGKIEQAEKYLSNEGKKDIRFDSDVPYIIFVNAGELANYLFTFGIFDPMHSILYGEGSFQYNMKSSEMTCGVLREINKKPKQVKVPVNIFGKEENAFISGIILTTGHIDAPYSDINTKLYLNSLAKNPIELEVFEKILQIDDGKKIKHTL